MAIYKIDLFFLRQTEKIYEFDSYDMKYSNWIFVRFNTKVSQFICFCIINNFQ